MKTSQDDNRQRSNTIIPTLFFAGTLIYLEIITHWFNYKSIDGKIVFPVLFSIPVALLFTVLSGLFNRYGNITVMWILTGLSCLIFGVQLVYYNVFKVYFSFQTLGMANDAITEFRDEVNNAIRANIIPVLLVFLPLAVLYFLVRYVISFNKREHGIQGSLVILALCFHMLALLILPVYGNADYTPYDLYYHTKVPELSGKQLGVITLTRFDLSGVLENEEEIILVEHDYEAGPAAEPTIIPEPENEPAWHGNDNPGNNPSEPAPTDKPATPVPTAVPTPKPIDTSPNIMNIDFEELARNEKNKSVKTLHEYFASVQPTRKNKYTGMFKGYNLILITAEGFSPYAVHKDLTPTLYKLVNEGFVFTNFYTALWQTSTSDGEYVALTGLIPVGTRSMYKSRNNLLPFSLGHQFRLLGIDTKAYHNYKYTYYERNETHPNLGYDFKGVGNGLVLDSDVWPPSDLEMIAHTVDEYVNDEPFHVYYMTVSGHMNYTFTGNSMSYKNRDLVRDLPYSSEAKAYIACQIELDKALEELIRKLNEAGVADRTVIALSADHYPYGWDKKYLDELAGHEIDPVFEIYRNYFILWNQGMEERIVIDKPASSLDILPTLSNLFGLTYDSRLLMGRDILSDSEPLVILSNRSFITDKVMYNSETGEVIKLTDKELPTDYVRNINAIIKNKFTVSKNILTLDYYRYLFPDYPDGFLTDND